MTTFKVGNKVRILDTTADCPTKEGVVIKVISQHIYEVQYHDGVDYTFGVFFEFDLGISND